MLGESRLKELHAFIETFSKEELIWVNGYLSGIVTNGKVHSEKTITQTVSAKKISLVYGTETGNSKRAATHLATIAKKQGITVKLTSLDQYRFTDLEKEEYFFVVISTQGEGEPPATAKKFYDYIHNASVDLSKLKYSVLGLGDTSYPLFCKTGEDVDLQLEKSGGQRVTPLRKCDVDFEDDAQNWFEQVLHYLDNQTTGTSITKNEEPVAVKKPTGKKYYEGTILTNINLNDRGSAKETYHIEIGTDETIDYEPGDALAVVPVNRKEVVEKIIALTGSDPDEVIATPKVSAPLKELLKRHLNICYLLTSAVKKYAAITQQQVPDIRMDLVDLLRIYPLQNKEQFAEVVKILSPVAPRLYSISSSPAAHGQNEIHITVAKNSFLSQDEQKLGLCSEFLGEQPEGTVLNFYIHKNRSFRLAPSDKNMIMIGPGTGIAPFRSFLAERDATGATGHNWFFFGEQRFVTDFLYQTEIQNYLQTGVLQKLDVAFSRDQPQKMYVQHLMKQKAAELFEWIENGAYLYISGTKDPMSKDVERALLDIIIEKGNKTEEEANAYLERLKNENRYEKDVY
jgi:sulfite reductase (NADPH) flavoprotein alpha-component